MNINFDSFYGVFYYLISDSSDEIHAFLMQSFLQQKFLGYTLMEEVNCLFS